MKMTYYIVMDRSPFIVAMKHLDSGEWWWIDTISKKLCPSYTGKSRPRLDRSEHYVLVNDFEYVEGLLDQQIALWKRTALSDFYLMDDASVFLKQLKEYHRQVFLQHYLTPDGTLIFMRTILMKNGNGWRQEIGVLGEHVHCRSWHDNDVGSEEPMRFPRPDLKPISIEDATKVAIAHLDQSYAEYKSEFKKFCMCDTWPL